MRLSAPFVVLVATLISAVFAAPSPQTGGSGCYSPTYATCSNNRITGATSCVAGYYLSGGRCRALEEGQYVGADGKPADCPLNVKSCTATTLIACKSGFFLSGDKTACAASCGNGFYGDTTTSSCLACGTGALTCTATAALTCNFGYELASGSCRKTCPPAYYLVGSTCLGCANGAASCDSQGKTLTCKAGFLRSGNLCLTACPEATFAQDGACNPCGTNVKSCTAAGITACKTGFFLTTDKSACSASCGNGFYGDASTGTCVGCSTGALACTATVALSCNFGYELASGSCRKTCPPAYYLVDGICTSCAANVKSCTAAGITACATGFLFSVDQKSCIASCGAAEYASGSSCKNCPTNSASCDASGAVLTCKVGFFKDGSSCSSQCSEGTFVNAASICSPCPSNSKSCTASAVTACNSGYAVSSDTKSCIRVCEAGFYLLNGNCVPCASGAASCNSLGQTLLCKAGLFRSGGSCVGACPSIAYAAPDGVCVTCPSYSSSCTAAGPIGCQSGYALSEDKKSCVKVCEAGKWLSAGSCVECGAGAATCDSKGVMLTCKAGLVKAGTLCQATCAEGSFANQDSVCTLCAGSSVKSCTASGPTACVSGFLISSDAKSCVALCGAAEYASGSSCKSCPSNSASCDASGAVLTCKIGFVKDGSSCSSQCSQGAFANAASVCSPCPSNAKSCTASAVTACNSGYAVSSDTKSCIRVCDAGFYLLNGVCVTCPSYSSSCTAAGPIGCQSGYALSEDKKSCVKVCEAGKWLSAGSCVECGAGVATCDSKGVMLTCKVGLVKAGALCQASCDSVCTPCPGASVKSCTASGPTACVSGFLISSDAKSCVASCGAAEYVSASCDAAGAVLTCKIGFVKDGSSCSSQCSEGTFANAASVCSACPSNSKSCTASAVTTCASGYAVSSDTKSCIRVCDAGFYLLSGNCVPCASGAASCNSLGQTLTCKAGLFRSGGSCVGACPSIAYAAPDGVCVTCPSYSSSCTAAGPIGCQSGYALSEDKKSCVKVCEAGKWLSAGSCVECGAGVATCDSKGVMLTCKVGLVKAGALCQASCAEGSYANQESVCTLCAGASVKSCTASGPTACVSGFLISSDAKSCVASCGAAEYVSGSSCKSCPTNSGSCDASGAVLTCKAGFVKAGVTGFFLSTDKTQCVSSCGSAEFASGSSCALCSSAFAGSATCDSLGAKSCSSGLWLYKHECLPACPDNVFKYEKTSTCYDECPPRTGGYRLTANSCEGRCSAATIAGALKCTDCGENRNYSYANCAFFGCPAGTYAEGYTTTCKPCGEGQETCWPVDGGARHCKPGWWLLAGDEICVQQCPPGLYGTDDPNQPEQGPFCTFCPNQSGVDRCDQHGAITCLPGFEIVPDYFTACSIICPARQHPVGLAGTLPPFPPAPERLC
ncbi:hypothetical protein JCM6882_006637 [Rhodosporidiobolus microsporus]